MKSSIGQQTGAADRLRLVPDWTKHAYCWMAWAFHSEWGSLLLSAKQELHELILVISRYELVRLLTPIHALSEAQSLFAGYNVEVVEAPVDDIWMRDIAPMYAVQGNCTVAIDLNFNSWGNTKYRKPRPGDRLARVTGHLFGPRIVSAPFIAEGGAFVVDGNGVVYTSKSCLLHKSRNPTSKQSDIELALIELGAKRVVWLEGDEDEPITNGHVDGYVLPTECGDMLVQTAEDQVNRLQRSLDIETVRSTFEGRVILVSPPQPLTDAGPMFAASYLNVYTPNGAVIMPAFVDQGGNIDAMQAIGTSFPERDLVYVKIDSLATGGGGIRCLVQPVPSIG